MYINGKWYTETEVAAYVMKLEYEKAKLEEESARLREALNREREEEYD